MSFKYKVRPYNNEEGEFTDYVSGGQATIKRLLDNNWASDSLSDSFRTIAITDNNRQILILHHIKNDVFDIYFIPLDNDLYYFKKSTIELATQTLDLFFENKIADLISLLNKRTEDNDYVRNDFFNKSFEYRVTERKNLKEISWIWYAFPVGIAFIALGVIYISNGASILLFALGLILWLPGVAIHYQYYKDNHELRVTISKGSEIIRVTTPTITRTFRKDDIKEVLKVDSGYNRFAWGQYGFTRIEFKTGEILNLTCLLLDQISIEEKFIGFNVKTLKTEILIPTLDKKTRL
jgi:hypothetical protein